jgi:Ca2+-binding RTX toxin-like protein
MSSRHSATKRSVANRFRPRLQVTPLEDRAVPASLILDAAGVLTYTAATYTSINNNLSVFYDAANDRYTFAELAEAERGIAALGPLADLTGQATRTVSFAAGNINSIVVNLGEGSDILHVHGANDPLRANGGPGADLLSAPDGNHAWRVTVLNFGTLTGAGLAGTVTFASVERLDGSAGADQFFIYHGQGVSGFIDGRLGADSLDYSDWGRSVSVSLATRVATGIGGGVFNIESVTGGRVGDSLIGGIGNDMLDGGPGNDTMNGGGGNDSLFGGTDNDWLDGAGGNDQLWGNAGNDRLYGYTGDDSLNGGAGNDQLHGEAGNDQLGAYPSGFEWIDDADNDVMYGSEGNDSLAGGFGNDSLIGGPNDDRLHGDVGDDVLHGNDGDDILYGDAHNDKLFAGTGSDVLYGGEGDDTLVSIDNETSDLLLGEGGLDSFWADDRTSSPGFPDAVLETSPEEERTNLHMVGRFANGADRTLNGDDIADPTADRAYRNFGLLPLFAATGPSENDVFQGHLGDCWLLASVGAIAHASPNAVHQIIAELGDGTYVVRLGGNRYYRVDADLPAVDSIYPFLRYAKVGRDNSLWVPLVEKAYAHFRTGANTYASLDGGYEIDSLRGLNGTELHSQFMGLGAIFADDGRRLLHTLLNGLGSRLDAGTAVTVGFDWVAPMCPCIDHHAYTLVGVNRDAAGQVVSVTLRNPWGYDLRTLTDTRNDDQPLDGLVTVTVDQLLFSGTTISWTTVV